MMVMKWHAWPAFMPLHNPEIGTYSPDSLPVATPTDKCGNTALFSWKLKRYQGDHQLHAWNRTCTDLLKDISKLVNLNKNLMVPEKTVAINEDVPATFLICRLRLLMVLVYSSSWRYVTFVPEKLVGTAPNKLPVKIRTTRHPNNKNTQLHYQRHQLTTGKQGQNRVSLK